MPRAVALLARNPAFMCQCIASTCEGVVVVGITTFGTKVVANQFNIEPGLSAITAGEKAIYACTVYVLFVYVCVCIVKCGNSIANC